MLTTLRWYREEEIETPSSQYRRWMHLHQHYHNLVEVVVALRGSHLYGIGGEAIRLTPGVAAMIPRRSPHDADYGPHHENCVDFWFHFFPAGACTLNYAFHTPQHPSRMVSAGGPPAALASDFEKATRLIYHGERRLPQEKARRFLLYLIHAFFENLMETGLSPTLPNRRGITAAVKQYMLDHLSEPLSLRDLAAVAGYSPYHFHRLFLQTEGVTPRQFMERARVERACQLLKAGQSVTSVAHDVGFSSHTQLDRVFQRLMERSPTQWIKAETYP